VVSGKKSATPWAERKVDLRVDDSPAPLAELHRLLVLARAYDRMNKGDAAVEHGDMQAAVEHYGAAAAAVPDDAEMIYWQGVALASHGEIERSLPLFQKAFAADPAWRELTRRLPSVGILPDEATAQRVLSGAR
jgi:tetratricopeptide (TPR) repeat protein